MGTIARNVVGRRVLAWGDAVLLRIPIYRRLYPSVKMLIDAFSPERRSSFKAVVLVQHPREGAYAFVQGSQPGPGKMGLPSVEGYMLRPASLSATL